MQKLEILIAFLLSTYVTYFFGIISTIALFIGWAFANIFEIAHKNKLSLDSNDNEK